MDWQLRTFAVQSFPLNRRINKAGYRKASPRNVQNRTAGQQHILKEVECVPVDGKPQTPLEPE